MKELNTRQQKQTPRILGNFRNLKSLDNKMYKYIKNLYLSFCEDGRKYKYKNYLYKFFLENNAETGMSLQILALS